MDVASLHVIVAVENTVLRHVLLDALAPLDCAPEILSPELLLQSGLTGDNMIFLETSNDVERLVATAQMLEYRWKDEDQVYIQVMSYSTTDVTSDALVFRLWSIGTVIVQAWNPDVPTASQRDAYSYTCHLLTHLKGQDAG